MRCGRIHGPGVYVPRRAPSTAHQHLARRACSHLLRLPGRRTQLSSVRAAEIVVGATPGGRGQPGSERGGETGRRPPLALPGRHAPRWPPLEAAGCDAALHWRSPPREQLRFCLVGCLAEGRARSPRCGAAPSLLRRLNGWRRRSLVILTCNEQGWRRGPRHGRRHRRRPSARSSVNV